MIGKNILSYLAFILFVYSRVLFSQSGIAVKTGLDRVPEYQDLFAGKRIGIVTNHTAYNSQGVHIIDVFSQLTGVRVTALFGPEHGIRGLDAAGDEIKTRIDSSLNIPIYSLYGSTNKPTPEMLADIDILVYDIQDVGARYYTYISTLSLVMEAAAENNKSVVVLDRPNPITGSIVEGNTLDPQFASFVGMHPTPVRHGMTVGELAILFNEQGWLKDRVHANLVVIPMINWQRTMWYDQTGLKWIAPSPNIPDLDVATVYPGTCLFEGTNISEGRGTYQPFLKIGAPWIDFGSVVTAGKSDTLSGVKFLSIRFTPRAIPGMAPQPKYMDETIPGVQLNVTDRENFNAYLTGIALLKWMYDSNPGRFEWRENHFDHLCGTDRIRKFIIAGKPIEEIRNWIDESLQNFRATRAKYLLY